MLNKDWIGTSESSLKELYESLKYGLYKYVYHNEIIYIGSSNPQKGAGIIDRIAAHAKEEKFQPYLADCEIYYVSMKDYRHLISSFEIGLINQYVPILNKNQKPLTPSDIDFDKMLPCKWQLYNETISLIDSIKSNQCCNDKRPRHYEKLNPDLELEKMNQWLLLNPIIFLDTLELLQFMKNNHIEYMSEEYLELRTQQYKKMRARYARVKSNRLV